MAHLVLLGDSIFDNAAYTSGGPDVIAQVRGVLPTAALMVFNDAILRAAIEQRLAVIDLRAVCASPEDYANPIEPSSAGGEKIARMITALVTGSASISTAARIVAP